MPQTITIQKMTAEDLDEVINLGLLTPELQIHANNPMYYPKDVLQRMISSNTYI